MVACRSAATVWRSGSSNRLKAGPASYLFHQLPFLCQFSRRRQNTKQPSQSDSSLDLRHHHHHTTTTHVYTHIHVTNLITRQNLLVSWLATPTTESKTDRLMYCRVLMSIFYVALCLFACIYRWFYCLHRKG